MLGMHTRQHTHKRSFRMGACAVFLLCTTTETGAVSLLDAIDLTLQTHPAMEEAKANRRAQNHELEQQHGLYLPSLDISTATGPK